MTFEKESPTGSETVPPEASWHLGTTISSETYGTQYDQWDMYRMGKKQQLRRNFGRLSIFGFLMILLSTWENILGFAPFGLQNGGTAGLIWIYIVTWLGVGAVAASLAEMASIAPTSGGQYHWVSEFAPPIAQRFLSYIVGWLGVLGWQTGCAGVVFLVGSEIQGLMVLNNPTYQSERWHGTLLSSAIAVLCVVFNTVMAKYLPLIEGLVLLLHIFGFFGVVIPLWVLGDHTPAETVFTSFNDPGWNSPGLACLIGVVTPAASLIGADSVAHMSEEIRDASYNVPRVMIATLVFNGILGFVAIVGFCFSVGNVQAVIESPIGVPFIQVFYNATSSKAAASSMTAILICLSTFASMTTMAASSRQLFAFARDKGVPFSDFFAYVPKGQEVPVNSIIAVFVVVILLLLINIGSTVAFQNILSLSTSALLTSYMVSIACILLKRWRNEMLLKRRFNLGKLGLIVNLSAFLFLILAWTMTFFPPIPSPTAAEMNWDILIYGGVIVFSLCYFIFKGRRSYIAPVERVKHDL